MRRAILLAAMTSALSSAAAQDTTRATSFASLLAEPPVVVGSRLRVRPGLIWRTGVVGAIHGDTIVIGRALLRPAFAVALDTTSALQLSLGPGSRARGAATGALAGVGASFLLGLAVVGAFKGSPTRDWNAVRDVALIAMPAGVVTGATLGAIFPGERWTRVRLRPRPRD